MNAHVCSLASLVLLVGLLLPGACSAEEAKEAAPAPTWEWSKADLKRIEKLAAEIEPNRDGAFWVHEDEQWKVRCAVSARFTAELVLFLDRFRDTYARIVPGKDRTPVVPTFVCHNSEETYRGLFGTGGDSRFEYRWNWDKQWERFHVTAFASASDFASCAKEPWLRSAARACLQLTIGYNDHVPWWLIYGIEEYFRAWDLQRSDRDNLVGRASRSRGVPRLQAALAQSDAGGPTLQDLVANWDWNTWPGGMHAHDHRAICESFVDFLLAGKKTRRLLDAGLDNVIKKTEDTPAFTPEQLSQLVPAWRHHVEKVVLAGAESREGK